MKNTEDVTYSNINNLSPIGINEVQNEEIRDPHFNRKQELAIEEFKDDDEESVGTMDDYRSYKGITE